MTVATPPRPPGANISDDPGDLEALEALIEEARRRARRRRRGYSACVLVAAGGALAYFGFGNAGGGAPPPPVAEGGAEVAAPAGYIAEANARLITQKVVVTHQIFAKLKARPAPPGKPVTASGSFTADEFTVGPIGGEHEHCAPPPQTCAIGTLLDKGTITSTYTLVGKPLTVDGRGTVRGTATATGKGGSVTWKFSAPTGSIVLVNPRRPRGGIGPPAPIVGTGKALITAATGDLAQLKGKKGLTAFYFDAATGWLRVSALL